MIRRGLVYNAGRKKIGLTVQCTQWNLLRAERKFIFDLIFFLVSTEFHLDAAGFYLQLSESGECCFKGERVSRMFGAATDSGIVFAGRNRKQGEKSS